ncbi:MAG: acyl-CoA dehydrogenase family protein, partial [Chloroflexota bacterium]|nr:acyl-CoA dehydrogenase family protein [Chloroflexota bacterium]
MDLSLSHSQEMLKNEARNVVQREFPKDVLLKLDETDTGCTPELWQGMAEMGWLGMAIPEQYGGTGSSLTDAGVLFEELGRGPVPGPLFSSGILGSLIVMEAGSEEQKKQVLPAVAQGKQVLALALTEQTYGWEPEAVHLTAKAGRGGFVLDGLKLFVQDAVGATHLICAARTGRGADPARNITLFLVDKLAPGVSVRPLPGFVAQAGEVKLESAVLPQSSVLGEVGGGWPTLERAIEKAIPVLCAYKVGACQALFDISVAYSQTRVQF